MSGRRLNATAASLLGLLHDEPLTGWELVARARVRIGDFWTLTQSQVYRELAAMATAGLVEIGPPGPRDRKPHSITDAGREAFAQWLDTEPAADQVRIPLLLTIAFASHLPPGRLAQMISSQREEHASRLAGYRAARDAIDAAEPAGEGGAGHGEAVALVDPARRATLEYGLGHEQAVLDWLDALPAILGRIPGRHP